MFKQGSQKLSALYQQGSAPALLRHVFSALITSVCDYQVQEVRGRMRTAQDLAARPPMNESDLATECVVLEPGNSLAPFADEFSQPFRDSVASLQARLDQGCALVLARRARPGGAGREIAGYSILEVGGFSAAGIKGKLPDDVMFTHYTEVAQKYRGQRIAQVIARANTGHRLKHGIVKSCTAHTNGNLASERAFRRKGARPSGLLCYAVRLSFFRGLLVWHTPISKIQRAIASLDNGLEAPEAETVVRSSRFEVRS